MAYLIHFNKNHSPKNGQFTSGDGDADGVRDDHHNYKKNKVTSPDGKDVSVKTMQNMTKDYEKINKKYNESSEGKHLLGKHNEYFQKSYDKSMALWVASDEQLKKYANDKKWREEYISDTKKANEYEMKYEKSKARKLATELVKKYGIENAAKWCEIAPTKTGEEFVNNYVETISKIYDRSDSEDDSWLDKYK